MLAEAAAWWKEQMRDLVPASIRPLGQDWRRVLLVMTETANATEVELCLQGRGGRTSLGRYAIEGGLQHALGRVSKALRSAAVLQVPAEWMLERQAVLPLSAELDLDGVLRHEMDRLTPFHIDEVCGTARLHGGIGSAD